MTEIGILPKDIQKYILSFLPYPTQKVELLVDIRDYSDSLHYLREMFEKKVKMEFGYDDAEYSEIEIEDHINYAIYYNILVEIEHPNINMFETNTIFFRTIMKRLYMYSKKWFENYQEMDMDVNVLSLKNKIRFLLGIMTIEERHEMIYYHYMEDFDEDYYGDYDW